MVGTHEIIDEPYRRDGDERVAELRALVLDNVKMLPVLVTRSPSGRLQLLAGGRRFRAQIAAGREKIRVYVARDLAGLAAWLELDDREPAPGPMKISELAAFSIQASQQLHLNGRNIGALDKELSERFVVTMHDLRNARQLVNRLNSMPEGILREKVAEDIQLVDIGTIRPSSAVSRDVLRRNAAKVAENALPAGQQADILKRVYPTLNGISTALAELGPVSGDVPLAVRQAAAKAFRSAARLLGRVARDINIEESE